MHDYTYCGLDCLNCDYKEPCRCQGCKDTKGKPFHGECPLATCAVKHNVEYCCDCHEFPCTLLKEFSYDKEHGDNGARIEALKQIKAKEMV